MSATIPILNLYYLLTYAWDQYQPGGAREVDAENCPDLENLFAVMLCGGLRQLERRGVDRDYIPHTEMTSRLRGKLHLMESVSRLTPLAGRMVCSFDDLSMDVLHNQILKSTALSLLKRGGINTGEPSGVEPRPGTACGSPGVALETSYVPAGAVAPEQSHLPLPPRSV